MAKLKLIVSIVASLCLLLFLGLMLFYRAQYKETQGKLQETTRELIKTEKIIDNLHTGAVFTQDLLLKVQPAKIESEAKDDVALKAVTRSKETNPIRAQPDGTMPSDISNVLRNRSSEVRGNAEQRTLRVSIPDKDKGIHRKDQ